MIQLHLSECHLPQSFDPVALARRNDPSTSQQAAERVGEFGGAHHAAIIAALRTHGTDGLTVYEIAGYCELSAHSIGKRMNELERAGFVVVIERFDGTDETRKTPSGRLARVWRLM